MKKTSLLFFINLLTILTFNIQAQNVNNLTQHGDLKRTGWNNREKILKTKYITSNSFGKVLSLAVDDQMYAQPLVYSNLQMDSLRNVVFASTVNNTIYAFDADKGKPLWSKNYTPSGERVPKNTDMTGACGGNYKDFSGNIGIVGTPVIDSATKTMYFVSRSTTGSATPGSGTFKQYFHAIDITNGDERTGSPVLISASVAGTGNGNVGGMITFNSQHQNQRGGLLLLNGVVYIIYAGHCDWRPYQGWMFGYDATTLSQKYVYCVTPNGSYGGGGIWMSGAAPAADELGNIYVAVGNGDVGTSTNRSDLSLRGESALKLTPNGTNLEIKSFFTPKNFQALENADLDFGVTQMMLVPETKLVITGCKDGNIYVMNRDTMGGFNATTDQVKQTISLGSGKTLRSSLAYFKGPAKSYFYTWSENAALKAFPFDPATGLFDVANVVNGNAQGPNGANGTLLSVSSNGSKPGTGILWASHSASGDANQAVRPGILRAFDATDVTRELWNSNMNAADDIGNYGKFVCPVIANGKVYMSTFSNKLVVYGITDTTNLPPPCISANLALNKYSRSSSNESAALTPNNAFDGNGTGTSRWASAASDPQWLYVNLGAKYDICQVVLKWETALGKDFQIQVSNDSLNWTTIKTITGNTSSSNTISVTGSGRWVRMYGTARGTTYGYSLYEMEVYGSLTITCPDPVNLKVSGIGQTDATLKWDPVPNATSYNILYKSLNVANYIKTTSTVDSLKSSVWGCGTDYLFKIQAVCSTATDTSKYSIDKSFSTLVCDTSCGFLPTRWITQDIYIGGINIAGSACFARDTFWLSASGSSMTNIDDEFRFAGFTNSAAKGSITAKVASIDSINSESNTGVLFRENLDSDGRYAMMSITSGSGAVFHYRTVKGGSATQVSIAGIKAPYWVKIIKKGTSYSGYISTDSLLWQQVGNGVNLGFGSSGNYMVGIALCSHDNSTLAHSIITDLPNEFDTTSTVNIITTINNKASASGINIYPNPTKKEIIIDIPSTMKQVDKISVTDISGNPVSGRMVLHGSKTSFEFDDNIPAGLYILTINKGANVYHFQVIKN